MNWEEQYGIKISALIGGFIGGLISLTWEEKISFGRALLLILCGGFTSGYTFVLADNYWGLSHNLAGVFGFTTGLVSMRILDIVIQLANATQKDPKILLSIPKLFKAIKEHGNPLSNNKSNSINVPGVHATRKKRKDTNTEG